MLRFLFIPVFWVSVSSFKSSLEEEFEKAEKLYKSGDEKQSERIFLQLAQKGCVNAAFDLWNRYSSEKYLKFLFQAAKQGHPKAVEYAIEYLKLNYLDENGKSNWKLAKELYDKIYELDYIEKYQKDELLDLVNMYRDAGDFDVKKFLKKYNLEERYAKKGRCFFWRVAEELSSERNSEKHITPKELFQIVLLGIDFPFKGWKSELDTARKNVYENFKKNATPPFFIEEQVVTTHGNNALAWLDVDKKIEKQDLLFNNLFNSYNKVDRAKLLMAIKMARSFFESKASVESGSGGTGKSGNEACSYLEFLENYKETLLKIRSNDFKIKISSKTINEAQNKLAKSYKKICKVLEHDREEIFGNEEEGSLFWEYPPSITDMQNIQENFKKYVESNAEAFAILNKNFSKDQWTIWLLEQRAEEFNNILGGLAEECLRFI